MTVSSSTSRAEFPGNGVTTAFPLPFRFFQNDDVQAYLVDSLDNVTPLTRGTHYSLSGAGEPEVDGNALSVLTMFIAPSISVSLFVERVMSVTQGTDIINQARFYPEIHENVFDRLTMLIQQYVDAINRALSIPTGKNYYDAGGKQIKNVGSPTDPSDATTKQYVDSSVQGSNSYTDAQILRTVRGSAGETLSELPSVPARASRLLSFDSLGNPIAVAPASGSATDLAIALADDSDPNKGASLIGYKGYNLAQYLSRNFDFVTPFDYGGVGDGVTDDTSAFATTISMAQSLGLPINLLGGLFAVGGLSTTGVDIYSESGGGLTPVSGASTMIDVSGTAPFKWSDFTLDGGNSATSRAFRFIQSGNVRFSGIDLTRWVMRAAIFENQVASALITGGRVYSNTAADIYCYKASNSVFHGVDFKDCSEHVVRFGRFDADPSALSLNNKVLGCSFENIGNDPVLFELQSQRGQVCDNTFKSCRRIVKIETTSVAQTQDMVVSGNIFDTQIGVVGEVIKGADVLRVTAANNIIRGGYIGIAVGDNGRVVGNEIRDMAQYGILHGANSVVSSNTVSATGSEGIRARDASASRTSIVGNLLTGIGGAGISVVSDGCIVNGNSVQSTGFPIRGTSGATYALITSNNTQGSSSAISAIGAGTVLANNIS